MAVSKAAALEATIGPAVKLFTAASTAPATHKYRSRKGAYWVMLILVLPCLFPSEMFRFHITVDERSNSIHDEDGK